MTSLRKTLFAMLTLAVAGGDFVTLRSSIGATACCAKTHNECARLKTPDDCCEGMGHSISSSPSTAAVAREALSPLAGVVMPAVSNSPETSSAPFLAGSTFKRPHDPPHLHPVPLLI